MFDPCSSILEFMNLNWLILLLFYLFVSFNSYWKTPSVLILFWLEFLMMMKNNFFKNVNFVISSVFFCLLMLNLLGIFCYTFSVTSHFMINLILGLSIWLSSVFFSVKFSFKEFLAHLTPLGCPMFLVPLMVIIEFVSMIIRPLTLSLRLMANMLAGHVILSLLSIGASKLSMLPMLLMMTIFTGFFCFEVGVAVVQAYVFSVLLSLYWEEA